MFISIYFQSGIIRISIASKKSFGKIKGEINIDKIDSRCHKILIIYFNSFSNRETNQGTRAFVQIIPQNIYWLAIDALLEYVIETL